MDVRLTDDAVKDFDGLPPAIRPRVRKVIVRLYDWPAVSGAKPLTGPLAGYYRLRFVLRHNVLWIEKIGHRDGFYED
jgi:mRNA-degrading endonuclease RelE of RelBE toxin-antitoxin system